MKINVSQNIDKRQVEVPASKSYAQRAILAAALSEEISIIRAYGTSDDVNNCIKVAGEMGANVNLIDVHPKTLQIKGRQNQPDSNWHVGESGLGARLSIPIAAAITENCRISGEGSLLKRPMNVHITALTDLGIEVKSDGGCLPIETNGQLKGGQLNLNGTDSSQYFSGLLMALPLLKEDSQLTINNLASRPYLDMTIEMLHKFGIQIKEEGDTFYINGKQTYHGLEYDVEGDWSGAAFWVVYGALKQSIGIHGLYKDSLQADRTILKVIEACGAQSEWKGNELIVSPGSLKTFEFDAWNCPDLFPALVVLAAGIEGESIIHGVDRLKHKESDRGAVLQAEFAKLGLSIKIEGNQMTIVGTGSLQSGEIHSNNDHRIAMAGAIAAVLTPQGIIIDGAEAVNKSYAEFWKVIL